MIILMINYTLFLIFKHSSLKNGLIIMLQASPLKYCLYLIAYLSIPCFSFAQHPDILCKQVEDIARMEMRAQEKKQMSSFYKKTASEFIDVVYHRCEWSVDPGVRAISGKVTTYFLPKVPATQVTFDLADTMIVDNVSRNGSNLLFSRANNTVVIELGTTIPSNTLDSVSIQYHGIPSSTGFGSFTQTSHEGVPVIWTLSEPYGARDWWPCKNTLDDKFDSIDIFITCPKAYKGVSNGLRQSELLSDDGTKVTTHWKHRYPMVSYLAALAVTNYTEFNTSVQLGATTLPMQTFCYPESFENFKNNTQPTLDALQLFHNNFGDYPFIREKYGHTQFGWGGGEEHQTNSFVVNPGESLCAHELAHQWFGDKITCGSWEDIWLNEGFASYLASIFMENRHPESIYSNRKSEIESITSQPDGSVKVDDTLNVNRIFNSRLSYLKGSHLLYMLQFKLDKEVFLKAVRAYQNDPKLKYGFARTENLKQHLEAESRVPLDSFFRQWFVGQGYPSYRVEWSQIGSGTVQIKMNQSTSHSSVAFFELPVALKFKNASQDTIIVVDNKFNGELFTRNIGFIADSVFIDPEYWLISRNNTVSKTQDLEPDARNIIVYPNPFENELNIHIKNLTGQSVDIAFCNMLGQQLFTQNYPLFEGKEFITIATNTLASGKYILSVVDETRKPSTFSLIKK